MTKTSRAASRPGFSPSVLEALRTEKIVGLRVGVAPHRFIGLWVVVHRGRAFVRSWAIDPQGWFHRSLSEPFGVLAIRKRKLRVRLIRTRSETLKAAVDRAYADKYHTPGSVGYVRDLRRPRSKATTTELVPRT